MASAFEILQQAQYFLTLEDFEKAIALTTQLIEPSGDQKPPVTDDVLLFALQLRCGAYFGHHDYADTLSDAETLIRLQPGNPIAYFYRGIALLNFNETDDARENFNHLLKRPLQPRQEASVYHLLGLTEYIAVNYETSLQHYKHAIQLMPADDSDLASVYSNMAIVYFRQGDMAAAWSAYKTSQQHDPSYDHAQVGLAVLHAAEGQWDEALVTWRDLLAKEPHFADPDEVVKRYYRWTPPMADLARQIVTRLKSSGI